MIGIILFIALLLTVLWVRLQRDYMAGLAFATGMLVCLPTELRIQIPGVPDFTIHRLILITLVIFWFRYRSHWGGPRKIPFVWLFGLWAATHFLALIFTKIDFGISLKRYLDFVLEEFLFYVLVAASVRTQHDGMRLIRAAWVGLSIVALFAFVEKYTGFNPVDHFIPGYVRPPTALHDVNSTYPHRILLGTAMAMAWPLAFGLMLGWQEKQWVSPRWLWISIIAFLSTCYFAMSRGPWIAAILVGLIMAFCGSWYLRRRLLLIGMLAAIILIIRPGVWSSVLGLSEATVEKGTLKASSYNYRLELWVIAWTEDCKSPLRFLLGYGPGAGSQLDLMWDLPWNDYGAFKIESWDNQYAYDFYQSGIIGLASSLTLLGATILGLLRLWRSSQGVKKDLCACLLASTTGLVFMMTNALIYAKQLNFLFWLLVAIAPFAAQTAEATNESTHKTSERVSFAENEGFVGVPSE